MIGSMLLVSLVVSAPVAKPAKLPPELGGVAWTGTKWWKWNSTRPW